MTRTPQLLVHPRMPIGRSQDFWVHRQSIMRFRDRTRRERRRGAGTVPRRRVVVEENKREPRCGDFYLTDVVGLVALDGLYVFGAHGASVGSEDVAECLISPR